MFTFRRFKKRSNLFVAFLLIASCLMFFGGCTFSSKGMGHGFTQLGIYCIRGSIKFSPAPAAIAVGAPDRPTEVTEEQCKDFAEDFEAAWKFTKVGDPGSALGWTRWDIYQPAVDLDGNVRCLLMVYIPSNIVLQRGLGEWQAEFSMGNWSVTCPVRDIIYCAEDDHDPPEFTVFNTTQHVDTCEIGIEGIIDDHSFVPYPE